MWACARYLRCDHTRDCPAIEPTTHTRAAAPAASYRPSTSRELRDGTSGMASGTSGTLPGGAFHYPTTGPLQHEHASLGDSDTPPTGLHPLWGRGHILLWVKKVWRHQCAHGLLDSPCRRRVRSPRAPSCRRRRAMRAAHAGSRMSYRPMRGACRGPGECCTESAQGPVPPVRHRADAPESVAQRCK